ncbi:MAG TPA: hypothetical protein VGH33_16730 [Isosphaeraceae bacterium]
MSIVPGSISTMSPIGLETEPYAWSAGSASLRLAGEAWAETNVSNAAGIVPVMSDDGGSSPVVESRTTEPTIFGVNAVPLPVRVSDPPEIETLPADSQASTRARGRRLERKSIDFASIGQGKVRSTSRPGYFRSPVMV